ncbi:acetylglucosaminylphosphatidylinositol deacetylase [Paractinoplanes abujensis]|uniref:LmbE family N-acetylglucosaminyl deacetylase n=1 Tax=Paractinoplanes abujensis TaxID=882441 RepID=A0A7W7G4K5_9ACTN|nr:PIG-L family deacetylase [Actinoplanes abujensis]MBB4693926.1 LmbE family N-acetylglucosaminyl deacetylase [Actinoplanes abujensis]GID21418.1 acetylglucosaminylphosphatidylinositol deacetylase [Actinoplanes abujensis]
MVKPIVIEQGTPEEDWRAWPATAAWPELPLAGAGTPLVVAPHPDDEILGVAGLMATLGRAELVAVTDGEASHPGSTVHTQAELAAIRRAETDEALRRLGLGDARVHRLGQPDGKIEEGPLTEILTGLLAPGRWCLATWREDGHPDHEAVGRAAARACEATGAVLLEYPIWTWHWAAPGDARVPWDRCLRIDLDEMASAAKAAAIAAFPSQIAPLGPDPADAAILPPHVLARFARPYEAVFR